MNTNQNLEIKTLPELWAAQQDLNAAIVSAVAAAREGGQSWSQIGAQLGVSKQSAHERFGPSVGVKGV